MDWLDDSSLKKDYQTLENHFVVLFICCFSVFLAMPPGSEYFLLWELALGFGLTFCIVDQTGPTSSSNLVADLTPISSTHGNFWSLICLVTTTAKNTEVRTWHHWLCEWFFLVCCFRNGQLG